MNISNHLKYNFQEFIMGIKDKSDSVSIASKTVYLNITYVNVPNYLNF